MVQPQLCLLMILIVQPMWTVRPGGKAKAVRKRPSEVDPAAQAIQDIFLIPIEERSVDQWLTMPREVLQLSAQNSHLTTSGTNEEIANRIFNHFHPEIAFANVNHQEAEVAFMSETTRIEPSGQLAAEDDSTIRPISLLDDPTLHRVDIVDNNTQEASCSSSNSRKRKLPFTDDNVAVSEGSRLTDLVISNPAFLSFFSKTIKDVFKGSQEAVRAECRQHQTSTSRIQQQQQQQQSHRFSHTSSRLPPSLIDDIVHTAVTDNNADRLLNCGLLRNINRTDPVVQAESNLPPIPAAVIEKIRRGEFVNFDHLLPPSARSVTSMSTLSNLDYNIKVGSNDRSSPSLTLVPKSGNKNKIIDYCTWVLAWSVFLQAMLVFHSHLISRLIKYQNHIARFAHQYSFAAVYAYDQLFRQNMANNFPYGTPGWDVIDDVLYNTYLRGAGPRNDVSCWKCGIRGHYAHDCTGYGAYASPSRHRQPAAVAGQGGVVKPPSASVIGQKNGVATTSQTSSASGGGVKFRNAGSKQQLCHWFNRPEGCNRLPCYFIHLCSDCGQLSSGTEKCFCKFSGKTSG